MRFSLALLLSAGAVAGTVAGAVAGDGVAVRGRVQDAAGAPLAGAVAEIHPVRDVYHRLVDACCPSDRPADVALDRARSDADGFFTLEAPLGRRLRVVVRAADHLVAERRLGPLVAAVDLETVRLEPSLELRVETRGPDGAPLPGARVRIAWIGMAGEPLSLATMRGDVWRPRDRRGTTGRGGLVLLPLGLDEIARISAVAPGFVETAERRLEVLTELELSLTPGFLRMLEVRDGEGRPVPEAAVAVDGTAVGLTDAEGRLLLALPPDGAVGVMAETMDARYGVLELAAADPATAAAETAVLVVEAPETFGGQVRDAISGRPIEGAYVAFQDVVATTGADGVYTLPIRRDRSLGAVRAVAPDHMEATVWPGRREDVLAAAVDLALEPSAGLVGRVVDEGGDPVAGAGLDLRRRGQLAGSLRRTRSGVDGGFRLAAPAGASVVLEVRHDEFLPALVEAEAGAEEPLVVVLRRGRRGIGRVVDLEERPVAGASIRLWPASMPGEVRSGGRLGRRSYAATSEDDGTFAVEELGPELYDLRVVAEGFAPLEVPGLPVVFDEGGGEIDLGTIVLEPGAAISGTVVDDRGSPVEGAEVSFDSWSTRGELKPWELETNAVKSDADGRFLLVDRAPGEKLDLSVWHPDFIAAEVRGVVVPREDVLVELEGAARVAGRVVDPAGRPVAGARVSARYEVQGGGTFSSESGESDAEGRFELPHLGPRRVELLARAEGFRTLEVWLDLEPGETVEDLVLRLAPGALIEGRVLDPWGEPADGVRIVGQGLGRSSLRHTGRTDSTGRFRLDGLDPGPFTLSAIPRQLPPARRTVEVGEGTEEVEIHLREGHSVHGQVAGDEGEPLAGVHVHLAGVEARSDRQGLFDLQNVPTGRHRLVAVKDGWVEGEIEEVPVDGPVWDLEVVLTRGTIVRGQVLGLGEGAPTHVQILASSEDDRWAWASADYAGAFRLGPLAPGRWRVLAIERSSGRRGHGVVELGAGQREAELEVELGAGFVLSGRVLVDGRPEAGARVRLRGMDVLAGGSGETDFSGGFRLDGLRSGRYRMVVRGADRNLLQTREIELLGDEEVTVELLTGELSGAVVAVGGDPVDGARLVLVPAGAAAGGMAAAGARDLTWSDSRGVFRFDRLAEGSYSLRAERSGYAPHEEHVVIEAGVRTERRIELAPTEGLILELAAATGPPNVVYVAAFAGSSPALPPLISGRFLVTDAGRVRLASLPPGRFLLHVRGEGTGTALVTATAPGAPVRVELPPLVRFEVEIPELRDTDILATLRIESPGGPFLAVSPGDVRREIVVRDGFARVEGLAPGPWTVTAQSSDGRGWAAHIRAPAGGGLARVVLE